MTLRPMTAMADDAAADDATAEEEGLVASAPHADVRCRQSCRQECSAVICLPAPFSRLK
jgi:hypothetical protein